MSEKKSKKYLRPLLKLSGEMMGGRAGTGFEASSIESFADEIALLARNGVVPGVVIGGGNFFRGGSSQLAPLRRFRADYIGMLATVMNAICLSDFLLQKGVKNVLYSSMPVGTVTKVYDIEDARQKMAEGYVCIFAGGTGSPYFSTDSAAALRAAETVCDLLVKVTKVDGVYDKDPAKYSDAKKYETITYDEILDQKLGVMDLAAITICRDNQVPLKVISLAEKGMLLRVCQGDPVGTSVIP